MSHPDSFERLVDALAAFGGGHSAIGERQFDVFIDRQITDQVEALKDEADLAIANAGAFGEAEVLDRLAVEPVIAARRRVEQTEDRQQRGFAATRRPGDGNELTVFDFEVNARQCVRFDFIGIKDLRDAFEPEQ
jgi:hypothetical protein